MASNASTKSNKGTEYDKKLGMPGDTMCQKEGEKQSMKKITSEFECKKLTFPRKL
jgi:hypothetical protein